MRIICGSSNVALGHLIIDKIINPPETNTVVINPELIIKEYVKRYGEKEIETETEETPNNSVETSVLITNFPNGEIGIKINECVRGQNIFIIQTENNKKIHDDFMETLLMIDACKRSGASKISVVYLNLPYARSDKHVVPREAIGAAVVINTLLMQADQLICCDLHSGQLQGFNQKPIHNLYCCKSILKYLFSDKAFIQLIEDSNNAPMLCSTDGGGSKRIRGYSKRTGWDYCITEKVRENGEIKVFVSGNVSGRHVVLVDDMVDTGGTLVFVAQNLEKQGALSVTVIATHGIFSSPALDRLNQCDIIKSIYVTNTIDQTENQRQCTKINVIDISLYVANIIVAINNNTSTSVFIE